MLSLLWSRSDMLGLCALLVSVFLFFIPSFSQFSGIFALLAFVCFVYSSYYMRKKLWMYKRAIAHYKSVLATSSDLWIAWSEAGDMIGVSKQFKSQFGIEESEHITLEHILKTIDNSDAELIRKNFEALIIHGAGFSVTVGLKSSHEKFDFSFAKACLNNVNTISIWARNVTSFSKTLEAAQHQADKYKKDNNMLSNILDNLSIPVWYRGSDLKICYCNNAYSTMIESSKAKILDKNIPLISGTLFGQGHSLAENAKKTGLKQSIAQFAMISGVRHKLDIHEIPEQSGMVGYASDITELDNAIKNVDRLMVAQGEVLEALSTAIAIFDQHMRLSFYNSSYKQMTKFDEIWLNSKPSYIEILERQRMCRQLPEYADFNAYKQEQVKMFTSLVSPIQDLLHLPNESVIRRYVAPYQLGGLIFLYEDITDSLALKRENNTIMAVQRETINNLLEGICVFGSDNKLKFMNPKLLYLWGSVTDINIGMHISEFLDRHKDAINYIDKWETYRSTIISNLTDRIMKTGRIMKKDGSVLFFSYVPLPDGSHMHSFMDITDTCKVSLALHEKDQAISVSNNLKYEFISGLSSEIKEPINLIMGFSDLLKHQYFGELNDKQLKYCDCILNSSKKLLNFVDNLSEMNDINVESLVLEQSSFDAYNAFNEVVDVLRRKGSEKGILFNYEYNSEIKVVRGDRKILKQIISSLGYNFIKCLEPSNSVKIVTSIKDNTMEIVMSGTDFKHNGSKTAFYRMSFQQATQFTVTEQISIGLPVVKTLVRKHNGTIDINRTNGTITIICKIPIDTGNEKMLPKAG